MTQSDQPQGTDNVLAAPGFDDAAELSAKAALAMKLNDIIGQRGLTQAQVASLTGMTQPKVSQIRNYTLQNISLERLMDALVSLGRQVGIVVKPAVRPSAAGITVRA